MSKFTTRVWILEAIDFGHSTLRLYSQRAGSLLEPESLANSLTQLLTNTIDQYIYVEYETPDQTVSGSLRSGRGTITD